MTNVNNKIATVFAMNNAATRLAAHFKGDNILSNEDVIKNHITYNKMAEIVNNNHELQSDHIVIQAQNRYNKFVAPHFKTTYLTV